MKTPVFTPHPLLLHPQAQTAFAAFVARPVKLTRSERLWVALSDGDSLLLNVELPAEDDPKKPLILIMHGLGGSADASLIVRQSAKLNTMGYTSLRLNHRGCGEGAQHRAKYIYHSGRIDDIAATLKFISQKWPNRRVLAIGYSLSGNMLLNLLGSSPSSNHPNLTAALAVCPPIDLESCSQAISQPHNKHIDRFFSFVITKQARQRDKIHKKHAKGRLSYGLTLREFDERYTAPKAGYSSRDAYYRHCSSHQVLPNITVPTTILAASDDPIVPSEIFKAGLPSHINLRLERHGGHMGFYAAKNTVYGDKRWLDAFALDWIQHWT